MKKLCQEQVSVSKGPVGVGVNGETESLLVKLERQTRLSQVGTGTI